MPEGTTTLAQPNAAQHGLSAFPETRLEMKDTLFWVALVKILLNDSISCFKSIPSHHVSRMADVFHFHLQTLRISKRQCAAQQESLRFFTERKDVCFLSPMPRYVSWGVWPCAIFVSVRMGSAPRMEKRMPTGNPSQSKLGNRRQASTGDKHIERKSGKSEN